MAAQLMESVLASELDHLVLPEILVQKKNDCVSLDKNVATSIRI